MKKTKLLWLSMTLIGTLVSLAACGNNDKTSQQPSSSNVGASTEENVESESTGDEIEASTIGTSDVEEYPVSEDMQAMLGELNTYYSKVNWDVEYQPAEGIIVSESIYTCVGDNGAEPYYLVIGYTNLNDSPVKITCQGDIMNANGSVNHVDVDEAELAVWPGNTVVRRYIGNLEEPSGDIIWNTFNVETSDERYIPFDISIELSQDDGYVVVPTFTSDENLKYYDCGMAILLDENGKVLSAEAPPLSNRVTEFSNNESYDGKVTDAVFFINPRL